MGSLTYKGEKTVFCKDDRTGPVCQQLYDALVALQTGNSEDKHGWVLPLKQMPQVIDSVAEQ